MSPTRGSRFDAGGYQGPATDSAELRRAKAIQARSWTIGSTTVSLEVVPLTGGRPDLFEVALQTNDRLAGASVYVPCMIRGGGAAEAAFARTAELIDSGTVPDHIILPPGTPLGW